MSFPVILLSAFNRLNDRLEGRGMFSYNYAVWKWFTLKLTMQVYIQCLLCIPSVQWPYDTENVRILWIWRRKFRRNLNFHQRLTACSVWQANTFLEGPALLLIPWQSVASPIPQVFYLLIPNLMSVSKTTQIFMFQHTCPRASCLQSPLSRRGGGGSKKQILTLPTLSIEGCPYAKR